ncbi:hypothetical protein DBR47_02885 [Paucibacter sp. KBW04]|uniref:sensor histidine kinase n=1 Tax=Paucibacter sp. KBW04 TaxID=2153361 RepID=UPI000F57C362|nr:ATP-binding protein [Paucibacter sp. KBW04]RQO63491.1 hypothetical protein DBR47_02885 [Paucibacter sp. KBW04]
MKASLPNARPQRLRARSDLAWVLLLTGLSFGLASALELHELWVHWARGREAWQLDELPLALLVLFLGLAWYGWRRGRETQALLQHSQQLARQLLTLQERERLALARELHDEMAQHCTAIRCEAAWMRGAQAQLAKADSADSAQRISELCAAAERSAAVAEQLSSSLRSMLKRLRPAELDELGLFEALRALCQAWSARTGLPHELEVSADLQELLSRQPSAARDTALYRVAQEGLSNVERHARAGRVHLRLQNLRGELELSVLDDGQGFASPASPGGLGLLGAAERAQALGGSLQMRGLPGRGSCLRMRVPVGAQGLAT